MRALRCVACMLTMHALSYLVGMHQVLLLYNDRGCMSVMLRTHSRMPPGPGLAGVAQPTERRCM